MDEKTTKEEFISMVHEVQEDLALVSLAIARKHGPAVFTTALVDFTAITVNCAPEELQESFKKRFELSLGASKTLVEGSREKVIGFTLPVKKEDLN
jgi:hypothetical protein